MYLRQYYYDLMLHCGIRNATTWFSVSQTGLYNRATGAFFGSNGKDTVQLRVKDSEGHDHAICSNVNTGITVYDYGNSKQLFDYRQYGYKTLYTDTNKTGWCAYAKQGIFVVVNCEDLSVPERADGKVLGTLPTGYRPKKEVIAMAYVRGTNNCGQISVSSTGRVTVWCWQASGAYFGGTVVFSTI